MKAEQLQLVLQSLNVIQPLAEEIAQSFYQRFFEIEPASRALFKADMGRQGTMFMTTLSLAVHGLSDLKDIQPTVQALGDRHFSYGVKPEYFAPFRESFLWALEQHLGEKFNPKLKAAWTEAFDALSAVMTKRLDALG
jgi:nitric oxide dioxygenase